MIATLTPQDFVAKWRASTLKERSAAQEHFIDLCRLLGHPTPAEADPSGTSFTFEAGVARLKGGQGWADVWKRGAFAWEYKGKHADLTAAYRQLLQYREALENPPLLVVCDIDRIEVHTNFTNTAKRVYHIGLDDLLQPDGLAALRNVFLEPEAFRAPGRWAAQAGGRAAGRRALPDPAAVLPVCRGRGLAAVRPAEPVDRPNTRAPGGLQPAAAAVVGSDGDGGLVRHGRDRPLQRWAV